MSRHGDLPSAGPLLTVDAQTVTRLLRMPDVIDAIDRSLRERPPSAGIARQSMPTNDGELLLMPATGESAFGAKLVSVAPRNARLGLPRIQGVYVLFDGATHAPVAVIDAAALTDIRTAAFSGWATSKLARPDARTLLVFGAGPQAASHIEAMRAVRDIEQVWIISRTEEAAERLVRSVRSKGLQAEVGSDDAIAAADIVCCCTSSGRPCFDGRRLRPGTHINAIGSHHPYRREVDGHTMARAQITVETRECALTEAGDVVLAIEEGAITAADIAGDLAELAQGAVTPADGKDVTLFKSVGAGFEDLIVAEHLVERLTGAAERRRPAGQRTP